MWHKPLLQMGKSCHGSLLLVLLLLLSCDQSVSQKALTLLCQLGRTQHPGLGQKHLSVRPLRAQSSRVLLLWLLQHGYLSRAQHALGPLGLLGGQLLDQEALMTTGRQKPLGLRAQSLAHWDPRALLLLLLDCHLT